MSRHVLSALHEAICYRPGTPADADGPNFDVDQFDRELAASELATTDSSDVNYLFGLYDTTLRSMVDKYAPLRRVHLRHRLEAPWFDAECHEAKKEVRHSESVY